MIGELPDNLEREAAALWRAENPDKSVFACDFSEKESYRRRVLAGERARVCRGCGGANQPAIEASEAGDPTWALNDLHSTTGLCVVCAEYVDWDLVLMTVLGTGLPGDPAYGSHDTYAEVPFS